jgi:hypothetical protein
MDKDSNLYPIAFFSQRIVPAKCNYKIYDKKLLVIVRVFKQ